MSEKARIFYVLWLMHPVLETGIAGTMLWRGLHRKFKFFFAYIITQILTFASIFPSYWHGNFAAYFYLYWISNAVIVVIGFAIIHEVFLDVFRAFHTLRDLGTVLFKWAGLVMLLVAGVVSVGNSSPDLVWWMSAIVTAQRCVRIIQVGMVLLLLFFARYLGMSRRQHSFGIALGLGSFAVVELTLIASWVGNHLNDFTMYMINMGTYNASLLVWLGYMVAKSPAREAIATLLKPQRWEQSLSEAHHPLPADSLIPMFEGMVDRALSRTHPPPVPTAETSPEPEPARAKAAAAGPGGTMDLAALVERVISKT
jgi:hypothetical protein